MLCLKKVLTDRADTVIMPPQSSNLGDMMDLFTGSLETISAIRNDGVFGGIFGSACARAARSHGGNVYVIDSPRPLPHHRRARR